MLYYGLFSNLENCAELNTAVQNLNKLDVLIEVNVGQNRCGVEPGEPVAEFLKQLLHFDNLNFVGILCYQGWNQHIRKEDERRTAVVDIVGGKERLYQ